MMSRVPKTFMHSVNTSICDHTAKIKFCKSALLTIFKSPFLENANSIDSNTFIYNVK